jgi:23S rRNA (cytidine1920-2'-O)/16S rRNA (cytidine1409-2'-O)-methyltransferase
MRIDAYIQKKFNLKSRTYAQQLVETGCVFLNGKVVLKASAEVSENASVEIVSNDNYASQGAYKLERAFSEFKPNVRSKITADIGCSNGGFTDVLLRNGAEKVYAVDVAECALPQVLLDSGKVEFVRANARSLPDCIRDVDFVCSDLSFISIKLVLGEIYRILKDGGESIVLVKPQFELDKRALNKKGIVISQKNRETALNSVKDAAIAAGFSVLGETVSPIRFKNKNIEFLLYLKKEPKRYV